MSGVGGIVYDKDAVYIDLGGSHSHKEEENEQPTDELVSSIISSRHTIDEKMASTQLKLFSNAEPTHETDVFSDQRVRRKVTFDKELNYEDNDSESESDNEDNSEDEDERDNEEEGFGGENVFDNSETNLDEENEKIFSSDDEMESEDEGNYSKWKNNLSDKASMAFYSRLERTENVQRLVYGDFSDLKDDDYYNDVRELSDGLFKIVEKRQEEIQRMKTTLNSIECTKFPPELLIDWNNEDMSDSIRDCFVTGKWSDKEDATKLLAKDDDAFGDSDEEIFGDFEDLETGEKHTNDTTADVDLSEDKVEDEDKARLEKKRKMKEAFNTEYDVGDRDGEEKTFFDLEKEKLDQQTQV